MALHRRPWSRFLRVANTRSVSASLLHGASGRAPAAGAALQPMAAPRSRVVDRYFRAGQTTLRTGARSRARVNPRARGADEARAGTGGLRPCALLQRALCLHDGLYCDRVGETCVAATAPAEERGRWFVSVPAGASVDDAAPRQGRPRRRRRGPRTATGSYVRGGAARTTSLRIAPPCDALSVCGHAGRRYLQAARSAAHLYDCGMRARVWLEVTRERGRRPAARRSLRSCAP